MVLSVQVVVASQTTLAASSKFLLYYIRQSVLKTKQKQNLTYYGKEREVIVCVTEHMWCSETATRKLIIVSSKNMYTDLMVKVVI